MRASRSALPILIVLVMAAVGTGGYLYWAANGGLVRDGNWIGVDFKVYYEAARVLGRGNNIYEAGIAPPYVYPPLLAILVYPLSLLDLTPATILWKVLQNICLLASGWLLVSLAPRPVRPYAAGLLFLGLLTAPLLDEIRVGESNSLILLLVVGAMWLLARGGGLGAGDRGSGLPAEPGTGAGRSTTDPTDPRPPIPDPWLIASGLLLALATGIKVLPVLLVAYFWWRGPRITAAVATGGFVALQLLSLVVAPASTARYWLVEFPGLFGQAFPYLDNQSLNAAVSRALLPTDPSLPSMQLASAEAARAPLTWLANLLVLGVAVRVLWTAGRRRPPANDGQARTNRLLLEVGLVLLTIHMVSGSTWLHHLVDLGVPLVALLSAAELGPGPERGAGVRGKFRLRWAAAVALIALLVPHPEDWVTWAGKVAPGVAPAAWLAASVPLWLVLALWLAAARLLHRDVQVHAADEGLKLRLEGAREGED